HVRKLPTRNNNAKGLSDFSILMGHRAGQWQTDKPTPVIVHLVSLAGVEILPWPLEGKSYVALRTLHSWRYNSTASAHLDKLFQKIKDGSDVLRKPGSGYESMLNSYTTSRRKLGERLRDGYTITQQKLDGQLLSSL